MSSVLPQQPAPALDLPLVAGGRWVLAEQRAERFTLLVFYRGVHCPQCRRQLHEFAASLEALQALGVSNVVAISGDNHERAATAVREWDIGALPVAYDLSLAQMRKWGLYVSRGVQAPEPEQFNEPGLYLIRPDTSIYSAHLQSTPFARPRVPDLLHALAFINDRDYPARGEL